MVISDILNKMKLELNSIYCVIINQLRYFYILLIVLIFLTFYVPILKKT